MNDTIQLILSKLLMLGAGGLASKGFIEASDAEKLVSAALAIVGVAWNAYLHRKALHTPPPEK